MDLEFTRVLKGHMMYFVNGEIVRVDEGEAIFINSRALHYGFSDDGEECDFYCALIHPIRVGAPPEVYRHFILPLIENKDIPFALLRPEDSTGRDIVHQLDRLFQASDDRTLAITALSAFFSIIADLAEREEPRAQNNPGIYASRYDALGNAGNDGLYPTSLHGKHHAPRYSACRCRGTQHLRVNLPTQLSLRRRCNIPSA
jgi:hypothetical protein